MTKFGKRSIENLRTAHADLQKLANAVIKKRDCSVISGYRGEKEQNLLVETGASRLKFPHSKHNTSPCEAIDLIPYPVDWNNVEDFKEFMSLVKATADELNIEITCGGNWRMRDYPHYELA